MTLRSSKSEPAGLLRERGGGSCQRHHCCDEHDEEEQEQAKGTCGCCGGKRTAPGRRERYCGHNHPPYDELTRTSKYVDAVTQIECQS
ncbi:MAG: hypothetical protein MCM46_00480 [Candidatus Manganitrophus sp. SB1]|nr:hypothetical protein [Candidatus Manganitrophus morganii]